ncbi:unnamed protein product [Rhizophagus irregularis]|nr:unnamed protein product [Rhizophagus irregularis]CAB5395131.1 unnamed protein product [Rhizophagus irregularis]
MSRIWTSQEVRDLMSSVNDLGVRNWQAIANRIGTRTAKQCRRRYLELGIANFVRQRIPPPPPPPPPPVVALGMVIIPRNYRMSINFFLNQDYRMSINFLLN